MSDFLQPHGLQSTRLLCLWHSPCKNTEVGSQSLLQGIFLTQGLNPRRLYFRQILYHLSHQGSPSSQVNYRPKEARPFSNSIFFKKNMNQEFSEKGKEEIIFFFHFQEYTWPVLSFGQRNSKDKNHHDINSKDYVVRINSKV